MIRTAAVIGLTFCLTATGWAEGDPEAGQAKATPCAACHGADGNSVNPEWPSIAGQHAGYIVKQLEAYKNGDRVNALMTAMAMPLDDQDRADLAAYYSSQSLTPKTADPELAEAGEKLYRGGNPATGVAACTACHGPTGRGVPGAMMPRIAGQHAAYSAMQLKLYAAGERSTDKDQMMRNVASAMSEAEIAAVSAYIQGLR